LKVLQPLCANHRGYLTGACHTLLVTLVPAGEMHSDIEFRGMAIFEQNRVLCLRINLHLCSSETSGVEFGMLKIVQGRSMTSSYVLA
jgi:hypothetical protein